MKKYFSAITALIFFVIIIFDCKAEKPGEAESINVYNWGEYIASETAGEFDVNQKFTDETGIKVNYKTFQNNEELFAKLLGGGADYDVIIPSDYMVSRLIQNDMLAKLNFSNIPNKKFISKNFKNLDFDPRNEYSVPYMWGLVGIFYNSSEVMEPEEDISWDILWNPKYKNKILMFDNARDSFAISLIRLGHSVNTSDPEHWRRAADELILQKPLIQAYVMDQIFDKIGNGDAVLAPYYAGDAASMIKSNPNIKFVIPRGGTNRFVDAMCIPKNSHHKEAAERYINFMCRTDIALANVNHTGYSTPHTVAFALLSDEIKQNKIFYPDDETIESSQVFVNLPQNINKLMDELWVELKAGGKIDNERLLVVILLGFVIIYIAVVLYKKSEQAE